ncbi:MAG: Asp-tRNA(Asn)/Glu-tRNA(Gln) amidotransferase GatCAB subunit C [Micavibrio sp.]|nr:Asp-tRNA(Asn)/Glu-tRNA(Gln) amidotransferase GatCAB subunit C [Micavibrio sp.]|tara:strand:+ start:2083 stop:2391 length:309 start_codon:yes stop_codon:yes gene_type:complete
MNERKGQDNMDRKTVKKVARLARLELNDTQEERLVEQLGNIIGFVETLSEVDTNNVEPLASVVDNELRLREDKVVDGGQQDAVLKNAPETAEGYFVISKVVE